MWWYDASDDDINSDYLITETKDCKTAIEAENRHEKERNCTTTRDECRPILSFQKAALYRRCVQEADG
jgi:hypothetical protein